MAINRVVLGIEEILDFSDATVDAPTALKGVVGYNSKGERFVGEYEGLNISDSTISPSTVLKGYKGYDAAGQPFVGEYEGVDVSRATITPSTVLRGYIGHNAQGEEFVGEYEALDISDSTITPETVLKGYKGYDATGKPFVGTYVPTGGDSETTYEVEEILTSGTFTVPAGVTSIDVHLVGGGAGGPTTPNGVYGKTDTIIDEGYIGGGSGYTKTVTLDVVSGETLDVTVGNGGAAGADGEASIIKRGSTILAQADGGKTDGSGGSGGGAAGYVYAAGTQGFLVVAGGSGGTDGNDGKTIYSTAATFSLGGSGQGSTTRDFGESTGTLRCKGGAGSNVGGTSVQANSGNGGNAPKQKSTGGQTSIETQATAGSSGIVLIRWAAA